MSVNIFNINGFVGKMIRAPRTIYRIIAKKAIKVYKYVQHKCIETIQSIRFRRAKRRLEHKNTLNVVFFAVSESGWKVDSVYKAMIKDSRFNPLILVCPVVDYGWDNMLMRMRNAYNYFKERGYNVIRAYDETTKQYVDVRKELKPDIIFYTNPYKGLIEDRYYITQYKDILTCYVPYGYTIELDEFTFDLPFHNLLWRFYLECQSNIDDINRKCCYTRKNHYVVGYPVLDTFNKEVAKKFPNKKYIIWAPHHTIEPAFGILFRDSFIKYSSLMKQLSDKYSEQVFFIFRPHPLLKNKLYLHKDWGKEKTDAYYESWNNEGVSMLSDGKDYIDEFALSDAMIHDSDSFIVEYLYYQKPVLFLSKRPNPDTLTKSANMALDCSEFANDKEDIETFILRVINNEPDPLYKEKMNYKKDYLLSPNAESSAQAIINDLYKSLNWK